MWLRLTAVHVRIHSLQTHPLSLYFPPCRQILPDDSRSDCFENTTSFALRSPVHLSGAWSFVYSFLHCSCSRHLLNLVIYGRQRLVAFPVVCDCSVFITLIFKDTLKTEKRCENRKVSNDLVVDMEQKEDEYRYRLSFCNSYRCLVRSFASLRTFGSRQISAKAHQYPYVLDR